jgi:hypothetical protein
LITSERGNSPAALRERLIQLRADALRQLAEAETIDSGLLRLLVDANSGLRVLDALDEEDRS